MLRSHIESFIKAAQVAAKQKNNPADTVSIDGVFITPDGQYPTLGVERFAEVADFTKDRCTTYAIRVRLQPSIYFNKLVPFRDDLEFKMITSSGTDRVIREFVAVPIVDRDVRSESNNTAATNLEALDVTELVAYEFQLIEKGFARIKNIPVGGIYPMGTPDAAIMNILERKTQELNIPGYDRYKGMYMHLPIDNTNKYRQIVIPGGTRMIDLPGILQNHPEYGVYTKGLGCFYKQNYWWIYPLFNVNLVDNHPRPVDIIRVPQNKIPTLDATFYKSDTSMTIIATGTSEHEDGADIRKQNDGVGKRVIMADAVAGDTGYHYNNGRAVTTRADKLQEYKLSDRRDGEEWIPIDRTPTGNVCKPLSENAMNEGEVVIVEWQNGDIGYLEPGQPVRFQYMYNDNEMMTRRGVLLGYRSDYKAITGYARPVLKRTTVLHIFLKRQAKYKAEPQQ